MPIQTPQWTDFLTCTICCNEYDQIHNPVSLGCGHTLCKLCLSKLQRKQCPYDQAVFTIDINDLPVNYALLQLVSSTNITHSSERNQAQLKLSSVSISAEDFLLYSKALKHIEDIALYLKPFSSIISSSSSVNVLSRPMQRKLVMLVNCQLLEEEGRVRALKAARSLGERTVTELIIQHQNPQQLSTNLWAAVRARGCQFLGPAMQEEVLKLVLLALEDGSALSRKVLVMFVVQRLEPHFPQASKTSIGHVVQLLYRASCFVVSKREGDSSLMKLKEEFRTYETLRREHDAQIVEIATEAGLRIAPDQWSALLYGDTAHKSHMQSIIDKLQNPQSFAQSVQELVIALQRTGDPGNLCILRHHLEYLAEIDVNRDFGAQIWSAVTTALEATLIVVSGLVNFIKNHGCRKSSIDPGNNIAVHVSKYKISLCRDLSMNGTCPRGINCTFAHSEEELVKYRSKHRKYQRKDSENGVYSKFSNVNAASSGQNVDSRMEECNHGHGRNVSVDELNGLFCKPGNFNGEYNDSTFFPFNEMIYSTKLVTSPSSVPVNDSYKTISSQYLLAMNQRKQQIIAELQQVLSDVQNQHSENYNYDIGESSGIFNSSGSESSFAMKGPLPQLGFRGAIMDHHSVLFNPSLQDSELNLPFDGSSVMPEWNLVQFRDQTHFDGANSMISRFEEPLYRADDWNINRSRLDSASTSGDTMLQANPSHLSSDVHESLLLESVKLQDQLRGLKKQITSIKDKAYEDGIAHDLRALELRLECELAEEEKKLWPADTKE